MSSRDATLLSNNTLAGGSVTHVGQIFFDQDLITLVEAEEPYASNTQDITENSSDSILSEEAGTVDPFMEYVLLGDSVADGIFGWLAFGMDSNSAYNITPAAYLTENGGVENENAGGGMGGGSPPGGSGGPPSGTGMRPSGTGAPASGVASSTGSAVTTTLLTVSSSAANALAGTSTPRGSVSGARPSFAAPSNGQQHGGGKGRPSGSGAPPSGRPSGRPSGFPSGAPPSGRPSGRPSGAPGNGQPGQQQNQEQAQQQKHQQTQQKQKGGY